MNRRKLLATLGTAAAGTSAAVGTGAFTSVSAERSVSVAVAGDQNAFLALSPCENSPNRHYAEIQNGELVLELTGDNADTTDGDDILSGAGGVNAEALSVFDDVFEIRNQSTQSVGVWLHVDAETVPSTGDPRIEFYLDGSRGDAITGSGNAVCLGVGDSICVGFLIRTDDLDAGATEADLFESTDPEMVVNADAEVGCEAPTGGGGSGLRRLSTGVADWQVTSLPSGASPPTGDTLPYSAYEISPPPVWATSGTDAKWVDPFNDGERIDDPAGEYDYELEFEVATERTLVVEEYGSDNEVEFFLDGTSIGGTGGGNAFQSLRSNVSSQLVDAGPHTLRAAVTNRPKNPSVPAGQDTNPTGLLVAARLDP